MITLLRVLASFAIVGLLLWLFVRASNGKLGALMTGSAKRRTTNPLVVLDRQQLTKGAAIALVRAGERHLLVGVGDHGVQLLAEGDDLLTEDAALEMSEAEMGAAVVRTRDVVSDRRIEADAPTSSNSGISSKPGISSHPDLPNARTRLGRATAPRPPRMSFIAALREMTVRRS